MNTISGILKIGTCSWNYDSWVGLVYTKKQNKASEYLPEYSKIYNTVEIDSWFYKLPSVEEVKDYANAVNENFSFTCKVPEAITLTHLRNKTKNESLIINENFLSADLFKQFLSHIEPIFKKLDALIFQFEYLNKQKMASLNSFIIRFNEFLEKINLTLPIAIETRNSNYLKPEFFDFIAKNNLIYVFNEIKYMPAITEVYKKFADYLINEKVIIRLLGGDRSEIEKITGSKWNSIVSPKDELNDIIIMVSDLLAKNKTVIVNVNNHYEGSAPLTIKKIKQKLEVKS